MIKLIYKCLHCNAGLALDRDSNQMTPARILDMAYDGSSYWPKMAPHPCEPGIIGVAQLVAVRE